MSAVGNGEVWVWSWKLSWRRENLRMRLQGGNYIHSGPSFSKWMIFWNAKESRSPSVPGITLVYCIFRYAFYTYRVFAKSLVIRLPSCSHGYMLVCHTWTLNKASSDSHSLLQFHLEEQCGKWSVHLQRRFSQSANIYRSSLNPLSPRTSSQNLVLLQILSDWCPSHQISSFSSSPSPTRQHRSHRMNLTAAFDSAPKNKRTLASSPEVWIGTVKYRIYRLRDQIPYL